jgi:hypothetical protein
MNKHSLRRTLALFPGMLLSGPPTEARCVLGSAYLSDDAFVEQFEQCTYPNAAFKHADHIRLGWIYARTYEYPAAEQKMAQGIRRFASSCGAAHKFHATLTIGWMKLIAGAVWMTPQIDAFDDFLDAHEWLLNKGALSAFYSNGLLFSDDAKSAWIAPDLRPLPSAPRCSRINGALPAVNYSSSSSNSNGARP